MKTFSCICLFICCLNILNSQQTKITKEWTSTFGEVGLINRTSTAIDSKGSLITVSNKVMPTGDTDVYVSKLDKNGILDWEKTYNGAGDSNDLGIDLAINSSDEIIVVSAIGESSLFDFGILKYSSSGKLLWSHKWNGEAGSIDYPSDVDIDETGNIYIAGGTQDSLDLLDYAVIKLNSLGVFQWASTYDHAGQHDAATSILVLSDKVVVTGASATSWKNWDFATLSLDLSNGSILKEQRNHVPGFGRDSPIALTSDIEDNVYITGYSEMNGAWDSQTIKLNSNLDLEWAKIFNSGFDDITNSIGVDENGNVYVAGYSSNEGGTKYLIIQYDSSGNQIWVNDFGDIMDARIAAVNALAITDKGDVIVVGTTDIKGKNSITIVGYRKDGHLEFITNYSSGEDYAESVSISGKDIYITARSVIEKASVLRTVKYTDEGQE